MIPIEEALTRLVEHREVFHDEMKDIVKAMIEGKLSPVQISALMMGFRVKKETVGEITAAAEVLREYATKVPVQKVDEVVDLVGTGGDCAGTFNISTCASFVAAGAGTLVAKHCGRGVSSKSGSADVLQYLGINLDMSPDNVGKSIDEMGIGFMFAPHYHHALKNVVPIRAELKIRTVFNILGPMTNPANAVRQITGVFHPDLVGILSRVLQRLGSQHAMVVHGLDGLDEISISAPTLVAEVKGEWVREYELHPESFGMKLADQSALRVDTPEESAAKVIAILQGEQGPCRDVVLLNAAATVFVGGQAESLEEAIEKCRHSIDSGAAYKKFEAAKRFGEMH